MCPAAAGPWRIGIGRDGRGGDWTMTGSSSSAKIRSDEAIADCSTLNFSDMSLIGRKKRCEYCRNATSAPMVRLWRSTLAPPYQMISAEASDAMTSIAG
jgi:hypothetical protein